MLPARLHAVRSMNAQRFQYVICNEPYNFKAKIKIVMSSPIERTDEMELRAFLLSQRKTELVSIPMRLKMVEINHMEIRILSIFRVDYMNE